MPQLRIQNRRQSGEREAFRATAFYRLNLEDDQKKLFGVRLGNHTLTGLYPPQFDDLRPALDCYRDCLLTAPPGYLSRLPPLPRDFKLAIPPPLHP